MNDILYDNGFVFRNGDFAIGDSRKQEIETIMRATKGTFIHAPLIGFAIVKRLNSPLRKLEFRTELQTELQRDNMKLVDFAINNDGVFVNAERVR